MKKILKKAMPALAVVVMAVFMAFPASAVNGTLTFGHGINPNALTMYATINSTAVEGSMSISGTLVITDGAKPIGTYNLPPLSLTNTSSLTYEVFLDHSKGSVIFKYYVDGILRHTSTAPWNFDLT
jgi:hypothetical protein